MRTGLQTRRARGSFFDLPVLKQLRRFHSSLANRILEFTPNGITDFSGSYDEYLRSLALE